MTLCSEVKSGGPVNIGSQPRRLEMLVVDFGLKPTG